MITYLVIGLSLYIMVAAGILFELDSHVNKWLVVCWPLILIALLLFYLSYPLLILCKLIASILNEYI